MKIAILNCCAPDAAFDKLGLQGDFIGEWLCACLPEARFTEVLLANGHDLPEATSFDGYIVSGSEKGVYDDAAWMQPLSNFLINLRERHIPVFGICFGHQLMAQVYGGVAEQVDLGMVVGSREYRANGQTFSAHAMPVSYTHLTLPTKA